MHIVADDIASVWKPFNGLLKDWPLAYCNSSSVDPLKDLEAADSINATGTTMPRRHIKYLSTVLPLVLPE